MQRLIMADGEMLSRYEDAFSNYIHNCVLEGCARKKDRLDFRIYYTVPFKFRCANRDIVIPSRLSIATGHLDGRKTRLYCR